MAHQSFTPQPILSFLPPRLHSSTQKKYKYTSGTQKRKKNRLHFEEEKTTNKYEDIQYTWPKERQQNWMDLMEIQDLIKMRNITNSIFRPKSKFISMMNPRIGDKEKVNG